MSDVFVSGVIKGDERYVILFRAEYANDAVRTAGVWASNPELSLNWYDAAQLARQIRRECEVT